jgi:HD-GYP domain-containing protein (c-di-GMP phosphodiesterase class II)
MAKLLFIFRGKSFCMLRVPLNKIEPGMILARPIPMPDDPYRFLLQRDREVPADLIPRLAKLGVTEVWIRCRNLEFLEGLIDEDLEERQRTVYHNVRRSFQQIMSNPAAELNFHQFQSSISELFDGLRQSATGNVLLQKLDAFDNYLFSHSANVCYLAMVLGMKLQRYLITERSFKSPREAKDLQELGLGCLLHDVGKMRIPIELLNKPTRLTDEEMRQMEQHTVHGHEMVRGRVPPTAANVVLNHHQRYNGEGYPRRNDPAGGQPLPAMAGKAIPIFSRIATVCDVYDAATSQRPYSPAKLPVQVLHEMRTWCQGFFDPVVEQTFYQMIPPFPIGQTVRLSNGMEAAVVDFNPERATQPKVQALRAPDGTAYRDPSLEEFDLAIYPDLSVVSVQGIDVRPFLATLQQRELAAAF